MAGTSVRWPRLKRRQPVSVRVTRPLRAQLRRPVPAEGRSVRRVQQSGLVRASTTHRCSRAPTPMLPCNPACWSHPERGIPKQRDRMRYCLELDSSSGRTPDLGASLARATCIVRSPARRCLVRLGLVPNTSYSLLPGLLTPCYSTRRSPAFRFLRNLGPACSSSTHSPPD
jgi:hypothetical protein